ncbi:putative Polyketide synthase (JCVI) [Aspergillus mulundensis]|uniref:Polyketide synthase, putative (JCVI) n=1 Tax=Aspergillus mulundensis TaxID=1810919 RepID=A0A3D8SLB4_9EURO|nr:Polyketide synthase, putative (JCVI) [Aspergillus mulundensis]RDW87100.1 Polyketide synthase, putative (JCVI) [Aspergillus mulundensis]
MATPEASQGPPTISSKQNVNDSSTAMSNGKCLPEKERNVVLLFGCQWLTFTASDFRQLRATVLDDPEHHWMLDVLGELPGYYRAAAEDAYLPSLRTIDGENDLRELERWFRCNDLSTARFPLCYTQLAPLLMMTHFVQYAQWRKVDDERSAVVEIVGFCIGLLSSVVVSATRTGDLKKYGSVAMRLAMFLGALGDVQEAQEKHTSLAIAWKEPELKGEVDILLHQYPGSYITVQYDENRATIMTPRRSVAGLQQTLQSAGFSANAVEFNGRYHWPGHEEILAPLFALCNDQPSLQLPDASELLHPPRANATGTTVCSGPLHQVVLRAVLSQQCQWHKTFSAVYQDHLTTPSSIVIEFGPERCIPPAHFRRLSQRVVHFADTELPATISRDHELATRRPAETDIAIVGMACRVAGADDLPEFWDLLCSGQSQHREMPRERYANYETPWRPEASQRAWFGNFVRDIDAFDHKFFKKSPREAMSQDPQQRLLLQVAYQSLESAGYFSHPPSGKDIGCYIASCTVDYEHNINCHPASAYAATGLLRSFLAGKLSHHFGWRGPSVCVDTACSGSAVALHHACRAILSGDCTAALVGGANIITSPLAYDNLAGASFLSPTGPCKPFDAKADGYCRGEGFAAIFIKKLSDAIAHGDQVLATIAGTAVEQNSNNTPIVVPDRSSLAGLFEKVTQRARLHPRDISVVEAHGTGTQAGDPAEYRSVRDVLGGPRRAAKLSLGSVKGLVGHTEGVSGMIALCKVVLMIQNRQIPPQPGFNFLNPHIEAMLDDHIEIGTCMRPWEVGFRAALINNYGACGSNASMVITQGPCEIGVAKGGIHAENVALPFRLCGLDKSCLQAYADRLRGFLSRLERMSLSDIAFNITRKSNPGLEYHCTFQAQSKSELEDILAGLARGNDKYLVQVKKPKRPVILCFGGQVGRSVGVNRTVYDAFASFRHHLDSCDNILKATGQPRIYPGIFLTSPICDTVQLHAQLFALQYACARSWIDSGVEVTAVIGHSFGELTALCVSGVLSLPDALALIVRRAAIIRDNWGADPGGMLAVEGEQSSLRKYLENSTASIACFNSPRSFTVAGSTSAADALQRELENDSTLRIKRLDVTNAFHSSLVDPLLPALSSVMDGLSANSASIPIERATENQQEESLSPTMVADHLRQPVYFGNAVQRLAARYGPSIWLEAGSNSTITSQARRALDSNVAGSTFHSMNITSASALSNLTDITIALWGEGLPCTFWGYRGRQTREYSPVLMPPYQFEKSRHWMENKALPSPPDQKQAKSIAEKKTPLFSFVGYEDTARQVRKYLIHTDHPEHIAAVSGHIAAKTAPIAPATLLLEYGVELLRSLPEGQGKIPKVYDVGSDAPLLLDQSRDVWIELSSKNNKESWGLRFLSLDRGNPSGPQLLHCAAHILMHAVNDMRLQAEFTRYARLVSHARCAELLADVEVDEILQGRNVYRLFAEIVEYSQQYQGVQKLVGKGNESAGRVVKSYSGKTWVDAFLCDSFSQCAGFWVNCMTDRSEDEIYVASGMEQWMRSPLYADTAVPRPDTWHVWTRHQQSEGLFTSDVFVFTPAGDLAEVFLGLRYSRIAKNLFIRLLWGSTPQAGSSEEQPIKNNEGLTKDLVGRVRTVVADFCAVEPSEIRDDSHLADAGVDSLMAMELARELEAALNCTLAVEALLEAETFQDLVHAVRSVVEETTDDLSMYSGITCSQIDKGTELTNTMGMPDTTDLDLPLEDVLHSFRETKKLTDQFLEDNNCSGRLLEFTPLLVNLCLVLTLEAFEALGSNVRAARAGDRLSRIKFDAQHDQLVDYLYDRLVEARLVKLDRSTIVRTETNCPMDSSNVLLKKIECGYPEYAGACKLTFYTGSKLAAVLRGELDGLQLIFGNPEGQRLVSWVYGDEPHNVAGYKLMSEFIRRLVDKFPPIAATKETTLKILEMGAGTGGGTKWLLPVLAALPVRVEYTFSDISPAFLAQARRKFRDYPFVRYCVHDIEKRPSEDLQGRHHIVIASNAVHATSNLRVSTGNMRQALRSNGVLMMLEMTRPVFAIDLVFGLFRGWWVFNDGRTHAITSERRWKDDLQAAGYGHVDWTDGDSDEVGIQRVILATAGAPLLGDI